MGRNKQIDKPLTIEMQYNIDVNNLINKRNKNDITHVIDKNKIDHFNNTKPKELFLPVPEKKIAVLSLLHKSISSVLTKSNIAGLKM